MQSINKFSQRPGEQRENTKYAQLHRQLSQMCPIDLLNSGQPAKGWKQRENLPYSNKVAQAAR
jgi:hypothetical protein